MPKISVLMPVYNTKGEYLEEAIESILNQTYSDFEFLILDDGSTNEDTLNILNMYSKKDSRIKIIQEKHRGLPAARNKLIDIAKGEYLAIMDSDDISLPNRLEKQIKFFEIHPQVSILSTSYEELQTKVVVTRPTNVNFLTIFYGCAMTNPSVMYRKSDIDKYNLRYDENLKTSEDYEFWSRAVRYLKLANLPEVLLLYRVRNDSVSHSDLSLVQTTDEKIRQNMLDFLTDDKEIQNKIKNLIFNSEPIQKQKNKFLEQLFSVKNEYKNNIKRKVITVLGIKIKLKINTELSIIKKIKRNANNKKANAFLLYDCLIDPNIENIEAYTFFLYLQSINENAYYLICEESAQYQKLLASGKTKNIIPIKRSIIEKPEVFLNKIHKILIKTKYILTSFGELPPVTETFFYEFPQWTYIFIQHGVTYLKESVLKTQYLHPNQYNKILVTSDKEIELFKKYSFPENCLIKGGFPRWDNLSKIIENKDNSILFMFTYRQYQKDFSQSLYLKNINNLLNNKNLLEFCSQNNTLLYFAPHHANFYVNKTYVTANNNYITNIKADNISQYIKKCSCLVTDFSSVSFDFMLQNKPVLYYIPDKNDINLPSQEKFNIEKIEEKRKNLYNLCNTEEELIEKLKYYINNDFQLEDNIKENYSSFFAVKNNCCEDLYQKLKKI